MVLLVLRLSHIQVTANDSQKIIRETPFPICPQGYIPYHSVVDVFYIQCISTKKSLFRHRDLKSLIASTVDLFLTKPTWVRILQDCAILIPVSLIKLSPEMYSANIMVCIKIGSPKDYSIFSAILVIIPSTILKILPISTMFYDYRKDFIWSSVETCCLPIFLLPYICS